MHRKKADRMLLERFSFLLVSATREQLCLALAGLFWDVNLISKIYCSLGVALAYVLCMGLAQQAYSQSTISIPNFHAFNVGWVGIGNELESPVRGPGPVLAHPDYPYISNAQAARTGEDANFRIADLNNPIFQPWVVEALRAQNEEALSGAPIFDGKVRCWPPGVLVFLLRPGSPMMILQTADGVSILLEPNHEVRRVAINVPHTDNSVPSWHGESVGHYEGDTLVVDTIGLDDRSFIDNYRTPHSTMLHVVERYRMIDDGQMLEVTVQVEDQGAFTMPWTAMRRFRREIGRPFTERVCAENNEFYFGFNLPPIPQDDTPDF
jgi:hypothetical protein